MLLGTYRICVGSDQSDWLSLVELVAPLQPLTLLAASIKNESVHKTQIVVSIENSIQQAIKNFKSLYNKYS